MSTPTAVDIPTLLEISPEGGIEGRSRRYEKFLGDMSGVYRDEQAWRDAAAARGADALVYWVDDQRYQEGPGALIVGTSTLLPGRYGEEFAVTRGHLHAVADRAELYYCLSGRGVMLLETVDGQESAIELTPGKAVNVPGHWIHRSVNVGDEPFVTLFSYAADAGQDYALIADAGGMKNLVVADGDGWALKPNPDHAGYRS
ncbi:MULTISPECIES: glucose-6-phosphate isomerase family protein [Microbacterium]|uniref:glucose-6-phosphate isomerase n=1 Tax=Microbacterium wangchenii TaxID=2541726 RepID=A0ABX5SUD6_9MICO|nr:MULTISPECIES: glucose-6-phosphate isomerase family protein [Microbacterium]MCK6065421.1 cupin domain-containing protein [Microbacterium sp. EYE_512]QBR88855.1 cupin domain-containing protein [Microbacterium wangchenii]TFV82093.1 cupin domain-containing protein [Microbacterium sp. dk485]TXK20580.1 cupin domain-containing protein [Microbacterium wangchenii]